MRGHLLRILWNPSDLTIQCSKLCMRFLPNCLQQKSTFRVNLPRIKKWKDFGGFETDADFWGQLYADARVMFLWGKNTLWYVVHAINVLTISSADNCSKNPQKLFQDCRWPKLVSVLCGKSF